MFYTITQPADGGGPVTPPPAIAAMFGKSDALATVKNIRRLNRVEPALFFISCLGLKSGLPNARLEPRATAT